MCREMRYALTFQSTLSVRRATHTSAYSRDIMWERLMGEALQSFLEERKDEIIDKAANMLADRFQRTKKYREAMGTAIEEDGE